MSKLDIDTLDLWRSPVVAIGLLLIGTLLIGSTAHPAAAQDKGIKKEEIKSTRNMRFGEIIVVKNDGIDIYNTTGIDECSLKAWNALNVDKVKKKLGAVNVQKNGPKYWMMDSQTISFGKQASFGGIKARWAATLDPKMVGKSPHGSEPYKVFTPTKTQKMIYSKGKPVYELLDADGNVYVMQAHGKQFRIDSLSKLGEKMHLPEGWKYRTRVLAEDLVLDLNPGNTIFAVGDEFHQYYTRISKTGKQPSRQ